MVGYLVSIKDVPIINKDGKTKMNFGTWIDVYRNYFDTVHFPGSLKNHPFTGLGCYLLLDGGSCFYQIKVDLTNKKCTDFSVNGEA